MPGITPEQKNSIATEATQLYDGDQFNIYNPYASEGRASLDTARNLSRVADETARTQLDQLQQTPEVPSVYPSLMQIGSIIEQMREDYGFSHISLN